jgi:hypothetical protein
MPSPTTYTRHITFDRAGVDMERGTFEAILASEGEASDGHVLSISGGRVADPMPMQLAHSMSPLQTVGSIVNPRKDTKATPPVLRVRGQMELGGDGSQASVRRDLLHMIGAGHVRAMSVSWEAIGKPIPRTNLASDHPFFVDAETETDFRKRYGLFFPRWRALEGSIVAVGADPEALIGRAEQEEEREGDPDVARFWRSFAAHTDDPAPGEEIVEVEEETARSPLEALTDSVEAAIRAGVSRDEVVDALAELAGRAADEIEDDESTGEMCAEDDDEGDLEDARADTEPAGTDAERVEASASSEQGREIGDLEAYEPGLTNRRMAEILREELGAVRPSLREEMMLLLDERTGRVSPR